MKTNTFAIAIVASFLLLCGPLFAGEESKTWPASDKAKQFVEQNIVIGFFASPYGAGWLEEKTVHDYLNRSRAAGITGHDMTLAAATFTCKTIPRPMRIPPI